MGRAGVIAATGAMVLVGWGCQQFQSDYVKKDMAERAVFRPVREARSAATPETTTYGGEGSGLYVEWEPADWTGDNRWDGFAVRLKPVDERGEVEHKTASARMVLMEFEPATLRATGRPLLAWEIGKEELAGTWDGNGYRFRLGWWARKPRDVNYVVMVTEYLSEDSGELRVRRSAPVSVVQTRLETRN